MVTPPHPDVFLAFGGPDRQAIGPIAAGLRDRGWEAFWDGELEVGERWDWGLEYRLRHARVIVFLLPVDPQASPWLADEVRIALERHREQAIALLPFRHAADPQQPARYGLGTFVHGAWSPADPLPTVEHIDRRLRQLLGGPQAAAPRARRVLTRVFVGREASLLTLADLLLADDPRPVLLQGMGGIGKSTLAARFFELYQERFPGGWAPVTLEPGRAPAAEELVSRIAEATAFRQSPRDLPGWLKVHRPLVHVENLDTAAHLEGFAEALRQLDYPLLGSSRRESPGPWTPHPVPPLSPDEARDLLHRRFRPPAPAEQADAEALLARVGGHPLALDVLAAMLSREPERPWQRVLRLLPRGLRQPVGAGAVRPDHVDVLALLRAEVQLLHAHLERELPERAPALIEGLHALSVLGAAGAGATLCAALSGLADEDELLDLLREARSFCLIEQQEDPVRGRPSYRLHPLVQRVLGEAAPAAAKARLDGWMLERLEQKRWTELEAEHEALEAWLDGLPPEEAVRACQASGAVSRTATPAAWLRAAERALPVAAGRRRWRVFEVAAGAAHWSGRHEAALRHASVWAEGAEDAAEVGSALRWVAISQERLGETDAARATYLRAARQLREAGRVGSSLRCEVDAADLEWSTGAARAARTTLEGGLLERARASGDAGLLRRATTVYVQTLLALGEAPLALQACERDLLPLLHPQVPAAERVALHRIHAYALRSAGRAEEALTALRQLLPLADATGPAEARIVRDHMARCLRDLHRYDEALTLLRDHVLPGDREAAEPRSVAITLRQLALTLRARGTPADLAEARAAWAEAEPLYRRIGNTATADRIAASLRELGP